MPDAILLKPAKLTPAEWDEMRKHPQIGFNILQSVEFLDVPAQVVLCHQERFDGGGYPRGLAGEAIPIGARIFAIADCFDAMTSDRPYRKGGTVEAARAEIARCAGTQFDPRCADAFLSMTPDELADLAPPTTTGCCAPPGGSRLRASRPWRARAPRRMIWTAPIGYKGRVSQPDGAQPVNGPLVDGQGRKIQYLRLSLTDRCNFRCSYCAPMGPDRQEDPLSRPELARLVGVFARLGIRRVRLTGGEPTLRRELLDIVRDVAATPGIEEIALTTNGHALATHAEPPARRGRVAPQRLARHARSREAPADLRPRRDARADRLRHRGGVPRRASRR